MSASATFWRRGLWRHRPFLLLWLGQSVSQLGSQVGTVALALTAVVLLGATPVQMGILGAAFTAPVLPFALLAGAWIDRRRRWPVLVACDAGRLILIGSVPVAAALGWLRIELLYVVEFGVGLLSLVFDVGYQAYLPSLVSGDDLVEGNSKLGVSDAAARVGGPGVGGTLVQVVSAPVALLVDAASFLASLLCLLLIGGRREPPPAPASGGMVEGALAGVGVVLRHPALRAIAATTAIFNLAIAMSSAIYVLYAARGLDISPAGIGLLLAANGLGGLAGAAGAAPLARRFGMDRALVASAMAVVAGQALVPLAAPPVWLATGMLLVAQALVGLATVTWNVTQLSLRQRATPSHLQGRVHATYRLLVRAVLTPGTLLGGLLGAAIGLRATLAVVAAAGAVAALVAVVAFTARRGRADDAVVPG